MDRKTVGNKLKEIREQKSLEIADLARASKTNSAQIRSAEEHRSFPRIDLLEKWLDACGTTLSRFFTEIEGSLVVVQTDKARAVEEFSSLASLDLEVAEALVRIVAGLVKKQAKKTKNRPR